MLAPRIGITNAIGASGTGSLDVLDRRDVDAVVASGGVPVLLPVVAAASADRMLDGIDGLLLSGGLGLDVPDLADATGRGASSQGLDRDAFERALVRAAVERHVPVLGVGRGHQVLNVALGGTLAAPSAADVDVRDGSERNGLTRVHVASGSLLAAVVDRSDLFVDAPTDQAVGFTGAGLQVVATWADGRVAAVEGLGDVRALGVQWRPGPRVDEDGPGGLFAWLAREAATVPSGSVPAVAASPA